MRGCEIADLRDDDRTTASGDQKFRSLLEAAPDAIVIAGDDGLIVLVNSQAEVLFGYPRADLLGQPVELLIPAASRDRHRTHREHYSEHAHVRRMGEVLTLQGLRRDGTIFPAEISLSPLNTGEERLTIAAIRDLTERRRVERTLARMQRYVDTAQVIMLALDPDGRITLINRYACQVLGWDRNELLGRNWIETCVPERTRADVRQRLQRQIAGDTSISESPVLTSTGEERVIEWRNTVLVDDQDHVFGAMSSGIDVTDRNSALDALRATEERMRFALESADVGIWDIDYATGHLRFSRILERHCGLAPGQFKGTFDAFIETVHHDDRAAVIQTINAAMASGTDFEVQYRCPWPDGSMHQLSGRGRVVLGANGQPIRGVGISLDVTKRHQLEAQYLQAQKMEAVGQLAGGVAHDFNNLLTCILGYCELALEELAPADPHRHELTEIQKAGTTAAGLTRQLLSFSRKQIIDPKWLDVNILIGDMRDMIARLIGEDVTVTLRQAPGVPHVFTDRAQIEQVILNLVVNARDAMPDGGTLTIETASVNAASSGVTQLTKGQYASITVADTGSGIPPEVQSRIFEPFFTTKEAGKGTGLGLATVHGIVSRFGGAIEVKSKVGEGTAFTIYLPGEPEKTAPAQGASVAGGRAAQTTATVLVMDDSDGLRELATRMLERLGYRALAAAKVDEAIAMLEKMNDIDILLTDVVMPDVSGPEVARRVAAIRPAISIVYMSGYSDEAISRHGVLNPGIALLHKPFTTAQLGEKIRAVLAQRASQ